jgi:hypothetical protein
VSRALVEARGDGSLRVLDEVYVVEYLDPERRVNDWTLFLPHAYLDPAVARRDMETHPDFRYTNMRVRPLRVATEI